MDILEQLINIPNIAFCIMIWVLVLLQRKLVENFWKKAKKSIIWREFALPFGPIATGGVVAALISQYPYPEEFNTFAARVIFGMTCGLLSGWVYSRVKSWMKAKKEKTENQ